MAEVISRIERVGPDEYGVEDVLAGVQVGWAWVLPLKFDGGGYRAGGKRTSLWTLPMFASDPKRTSAASKRAIL